MPGIAYEADQAHGGIADSEQVYLPVIADDRRFVGVITATDVGNVAARSPDLRALLVAGDIARPSETLLPTDSLLVAIRKMGVRGTGSLPVIERTTGRLLGMISRSRVRSLYEKHATAAPGDDVALSA